MLLAHASTVSPVSLIPSFLAPVPMAPARVLFHSIPPGMLVGMSSPLVHMNPEISSDPHTFAPERWLGPDPENLQEYTLSFSKGSRACLGINLAYAELPVVIAVIMRRF